MKFNHTGKTYQLVIQDGNDLQDALKLDEALWVAMSAPTQAYSCDPKFLSFVDTDCNNTVTTSEIKQAISWLLDVYTKKEQITDQFSGVLKLSDINEASANGKAILHSAKYILKDLNKPQDSEIDLATVRNFQAILTSRPLNGDGVMTVSAAQMVKDSAHAADMADFIKDGVTAAGGSKDLDGTMGLTIEQFKTFWAAIPQYLAWRKQGELPPGEEHTELLPFGNSTPALMALLDKHAKLVSEYFAICALQDYDQRLAGQILDADGKPGKVDPTAWPGLNSHLETMPLQQPASGAELVLDDLHFINPLYRDWWRDVAAQILRPVLGASLTRLTREDWQKVTSRFDAYRAYLAAKAGGICEKIDLERLKHYTALATLPELADDLAARDLAVANILKEADKVEQLLLYLQGLVKLCNNFISFPDLYDPKVPTLIERGRIVIDGRWFNLTFPVNALAEHSALATNSGLFIIYVEIDTKPAATTLAAPVTIGDKGALKIGKRGIFFDANRNEYNAKIVKIIENPVCLREALAAPFLRIGKMLETKVTKMSNASDAELNKKFETVINDPAAAAKSANAEAKAKAAAKSDAGNKAGMMMGIGVAFAAVSSALAFICKTLSSMSLLSIVLSVVCVLAILLLPIALLAWLRLRRQDLSSLLEGNGWAINSRLRLTRRQRRAFSNNGRFKPGDIGSPRWRVKRAITWIISILIVLAALTFGVLFGIRKCQSACPAAPETAPAAEVAPAPSAEPAEAVPAAPAEPVPAPAPAG